MLKSVLLLLNLAEVFGGIAVAPSNTVVRVGEKLLLECRTNNESKVRKWTHYSINRSTTNIYRHPDILHPNFRHFDAQVNADGSGILYTNSTRPDDAGIYGCNAKVDGRDETFTAQVVVMESSPLCVTNLTANATDSLVDGAIVWMQCSVRFRGFWIPTVEWRQHSGDDNSSRKLTWNNGVDLVQIINSKVSSALTFVINSSTNGSFFSCRFYFTSYNGKDPDMTATNIPTYSYNWHSDVIILPMSVMKSTVNTIELSASSSPVTSVTDSNSSLDWYVVSFASVSALSLFLVLAVIVAIAFCVHYKRRVSAKYATVTAAKMKLDTPIPDTYEILPYSVEDNYETIEETEMDNDSSDQPILDTHPTSGYSALLPTTTTPPVYSRVEIYERPFNTEENNMSDFGEKSEETISFDKRIKEDQDPLRYLELISTTSERNSQDGDIPKPITGVTDYVAADTETKPESADNRRPSPKKSIADESSRIQSPDEPLKTQISSNSQLFTASKN